MTSLGCSKNLVDTEVLRGQLKYRNFTFTEKPENADLIILNTCGFINDAKSESIQAIFEAIKLKEGGQKKQVYVTGCLSERYKSALTEEIPEIDAIFGTEDYASILASLGQEKFHAEEMYQLRDLTIPRHMAYIKISEGCDHTCSFCTIPGIRGKHRSRPMEDILSEARVLAEKGVKELILVSQDTSYYGRDLYKKFEIVELVKRLAAENLFTWIRPLYWYPTNFPMAFIHLMNEYPSIIPYLDMPIQHASDNVLQLMRRAERNDKLHSLYSKIREIKSDIILRTTVIVGHPGETDEDFEILKQFIKKNRFDRVGSFIYSDEEGTKSYTLGEKVSPETARKRQSELMMLQSEISLENNRRIENSVQKVLIDSYNHDEKYYIGRTYRDAPEIDNEVIINDNLVNKELIGTFQNVLIIDSSEYELYGTLDV